MKINTKKRGLLASVGALVAAAALTLGGVGTAHAAPPQPVPTQSTVDITKLEQPSTAGSAADGRPIVNPGAGIDGVTFEYYLVPGTEAGAANDIGTNAGQTYAAGQTAQSAQTLIGAATATGSFDSTTSGGNTSKVLPRGLYLIKESVTPAGVVPAVPFLVSVPLTDPANLDAWLDTIHIYPKNARITAEKTVVNATDYVLGETVTWTIDSAIPRVPNPAGSPAFLATDALEIHDTLTDADLVTTVAGVNVTAPANLTKGTGTDGDYNVVLDTTVAGETTVKVVFTADGLDALADAVNADADAQIVVTLDTVAQRSGVITNVASIFPDSGALADDDALVTAAAEIRYGKFIVQKASSDGALTGAALAGAEFRVYLSEADAEENDPAKSLKPSTNSSGVWVTAAGGQLEIDGLRDSDFADGALANQGAAPFQTYWLVETKALAGHQLLAEPLPFEVDQTTGAAADLTVINRKTDGGFTLPLTGGTGTALLTVGGIALLGVVLVVARRRRSQA